jgi:hypothetical protein
VLEIHVPISESFNEETNEFVINTFTLELEHSLASLSKWESHFEKPFLGLEDKSSEETLWYVKAMVRTPNFPPDIFSKLDNDNVEAINAYINGKQTATWFSNHQQGSSRQVITAEVIYGWMTALSIDLEWENRHLNRLFTLIRTVNDQNQPKKKMSKADALQRQRDLNAERQAKYNTAG